MNFSGFGKKFTQQTGILQLMNDLGQAMSGNSDMLMLGGGNPGHIAEVQSLFRKRMQEILDNGNSFEKLIGNYDPPQGEQEFVKALATLLKNTYGWDITSENIALTLGSQSSFFMLFNLFAGETDDHKKKKVLFPLTPEYIGYSDLGLSEDFFISQRPSIEHIDEQTFKYHIDFEKLKITDDIGAICVSRPTNPTGNVLTDLEIDQLSKLAEQHNIPLIIDNAYGLPFPSIIFTEAQAVWNDNTILCMSLSKLGLPGTRTGIVIANPEVISAITGMNAIFNLATSGFGSQLALEMVKSGEIISVSENLITPYYQQKAEQAIGWLSDLLQGVDFHLHKAEGALFLWLWLRDLPIKSETLYERIKDRGALVVSGHYFFPGFQDEWQHQHECIRITYSQDEKTVRNGLEIIAEEVKRAYDNGA
ncbi:MAG: valine--pyruvate transaminase [Gammaproteobacteria bacterium]